MHLFWLALFASVILTECAPRETRQMDDSQPISPQDYQQILGQGFATNYFKSSILAVRYRTQNIQDIYDRGFRNLRLRARADLYNPSDETKFQRFLTKLTEVVDECIDVGVAPVISWIHHEAEADATEEHRQNYLNWWERVAIALKDKSYKLSFNLFTELGVDECGNMCENSLRRNKAKYHNWTREVVSIIRETGGKNAQRILILASPEKNSNGLSLIDRTIFDSYMMVEWHDYAAGPHKKIGGRRNWHGTGSDEEQQVLLDDLQLAREFTNETGVPTYFGAWMPRDNKGGALNQSEVISFARFFASQLKLERIPWSLNVLDDYYDTRESRWLTNTQLLPKRPSPGGQRAPLNMSVILDNIREVM